MIRTLLNNLLIFAENSSVWFISFSNGSVIQMLILASTSCAAAGKGTLFWGLTDLTSPGLRVTWGCHRAEKNTPKSHRAKPGAIK